MITREEWLRHAVEMLDTELFDGDLDTINHKFQINCGICPGKKQSNTIQPYDGENVKLEDFFPTTISIDHKISDPIDRLGILARECVFAFFNEKGNNKRVRRLMEKYYFHAPFTSYNPSPYLIEILNIVHKMLVGKYGEFPGETVIVYPKEKKESKKNTLVLFCPDCGFEVKVNRKAFEKNKSGLPTCGCGSKMAMDLTDENENQENTQS